MPLQQIEVSVVFVKLNFVVFTLNFLNKMILMYVYVSIPSAVSDVYIKVLSCFSSGLIFPFVAHLLALDPSPLYQEKVTGLDTGDSGAVWGESTTM